MERGIPIIERIPDVPVYTAWDLGISDNGMMAISGFGLEHYVGWLNDRGYGGEDCTDWLPHDAAAHEGLN